MSVIGKKTKTRGVWLMNPTTKVKDSKKIYNRKKDLKKIKESKNDNY